MITANLTVEESEGWKGGTLGKISFANSGVVECRIAFTEEDVSPLETIRGEPFKPGFVRIVDPTQYVWFKVKGETAAQLSES